MRTMLVAIILLGGTGVADAAIMSDGTCPFAKDAIPASHTVRCRRIDWVDGATLLRSDVAIFEPTDPGKTALPVVYLPGGPGDAPVDDEARPDGILRLFSDRTVIAMNPRGVENTSPRPLCTFGDDYWIEDLPVERERAMTVQCRDTVAGLGLPAHIYETQRVAEDVNVLIAALGIREAGVMSVSYGTEIALHLLSARPAWLRFAILDSVSLPGIVGMADQLAARDRFLGLIERLCFVEAQCPDALRHRTRSLLDWTREFDTKPIEFTLGPPHEPWDLDGQEMLDALAGLATYPDGAAYAVELMAVFEAAPSDAIEFLASEIESNLKFGRDNFALLLEAYSDGVSPADRAALNQPVKYPYDRVEWGRFLDIYGIWNKTNRRERPFVDSQSRATSVGIPVLVLSGGVDTSTPLVWAVRLHRRFLGLTHYVFPYLGHATAFGQEGEVSDPETIAQMACPRAIIDAFLRGRTPSALCAQYRYAGGQ